MASRARARLDAAYASGQVAAGFRWKLASVGLSGAAWLGVCLLLMRHLGPEDYGLLAVALGWAALFVLVVDFGLQPLVVRDLALDAARSAAYASVLLHVKLRLLALGTLAILAASWLAPIGGKPRAGSLLALAMLLFAGAGSFVETGQAFAFAQRRFRCAAGLLLGHKLTIAAAALALLAAGAPLPVLAPALAGAAWAGAVPSLLFLRREARRPPARLVADHERAALVRGLLARAAPVLVTTLLVAAYTRAGSLLLAWLGDPTATGLYGAAHRWLEVVSVLPAAYLAAAGPTMARGMAGRTWPKALRPHLLRCLGLAGLAWLGLQAAALLLPLYLGARFAEVRAVLAVLAWSVPFVYASAVTTTALIQLGRQHLLAGAAGLSLTTGLAAQAWAIPRAGALGAAWATVLTEACVLLVSLGCLALPLRNAPATDQAVPRESIP